jgi:hypothetical protein
VSEGVDVKAKPIATECIKELERIIESHPKKVWQPIEERSSAFRRICQKSEVRHYWDLLELAAMVALGPESEFGLDSPEHRGRLAQFMGLAWRQSSRDASDDADPVPPQVVVATAARPEVVPGRNVFLAALGTKTVSSAFEVPPHPDANIRVATEVKKFLSRASFVGAADPVRLCHWWRDVGVAMYPTMRVGVRILLGYSAGNATLERGFGTCRSVMSSHRKKTKLGSVYLKINAPPLGLAGYNVKANDQVGDAPDNA